MRSAGSGRPRCRAISRRSSAGRILTSDWGYAAGSTLRTAIAARGPLPASLVAGLGHALALGLAAIARAGWVHLDIKPANIVLNAAPRLLDFELARTASDAARMTPPGRDVALHAA